MSLLSAFAQGFVNRVLQRSTAQGVVHLLNVRTNCGDNGGSNPVSDCLFWDTLRLERTRGDIPDKNYRKQQGDINFQLSPRHSTLCSDHYGSSLVLYFLVVNVVGISQNIRFKAIFSPSAAFSILSWVAIPLKHIKRLESLKISLESILPHH